MKLPFSLYIFAIVITTSDAHKIDFGTDKVGTEWTVVNDGVMGGLSEGNAKFTKNSVLFKGKVSLDNNGGFSSLRSSFKNRDLSTYTQLKLRYRSKGIKLAFTMAVSRRWYVPNYKINLEGTAYKWKTVTLQLANMQKHYIGKPMNESLTKEALKKIVRMGFITDEKKCGDFEFEVDYIEFL